MVTIFLGHLVCSMFHLGLFYGLQMALLVRCSFKTEIFTNNIVELEEKPRAQNGLKAPNINFNQIEENSRRIKSNYDPRKRQFSQKQRQRKKPASLDFMKTAEKLHFKYAQAQLQQAIKLQACLANRKYCE